MNQSKPVIVLCQAALQVHVRAKPIAARSRPWPGSNQPPGSGGVRVAMRTVTKASNGSELTNVVNWLFGDHLGSTGRSANANGSPHSEQRYRAWGEKRYPDGASALPTTFRYTGQREDSYINLYWYGSRWYDDQLGRFIQPDFIIPEAAQGVQAWDRYAYANNSPVVHNDPSGHCVDGLTTILCVAMGVGALIGGAASVYNLYQNNDQVSAGQVVEAAISGAWGGAVLGGGVVLVGAAVVLGASALVGLGAAACADGDCKNEATSLYRAVGQSEFDDIMSNNIFRPKPGGGSMDVKWFWEGMDSAQGFAAKYPDLSHIVEAKVPSSILETGYRLPNLDDLGPAVGFMDDALIEFNKVILTVKDAIAQ